MLSILTDKFLRDQWTDHHKCEHPTNEKGMWSQVRDCQHQYDSAMSS